MPGVEPRGLLSTDPALGGVTEVSVWALEGGLGCGRTRLVSREAGGAGRRDLLLDDLHM